MPRPRFLKLDPGRRRHILETAAAEFAAHGFEHASLNHVLDSLDLSKGVFYYYFDSKADLFAAVIDHAWDTLFPAPDAGTDTLDADAFWARLETLSRHARLGAHDMPWLAGIARALYHPLPAAELNALVADKFREAHDRAARLLRRGQDLGAVRTDMPLDLLIAVLMAADTAADHWLVDRWDTLPPADHDRLARAAFSTWRRIVQAQPPASLAASPTAAACAAMSTAAACAAVGTGTARAASTEETSRAATSPREAA